MINKRWYDGMETEQMDLQNIDLTEDIHLKARGLGLYGMLERTMINQACEYPIAVRKLENGKYALIAGINRFVAARVVGLTTIPAVILEYTHDEFIKAFNLKCDNTSQSHKHYDVEHMVDIRLIHISDGLKKSRPEVEKVKKVKEYFIKNGRFDKPIVIDAVTLELKDGYIRYLIAVELALKKVYVRFR